MKQAPVTAPPPIDIEKLKKMPPKFVQVPIVNGLPVMPQVACRGKSLAVLTPMYGGGCTSNYYSACLSLQRILLMLGVPHDFVHVYNESLVTRARNRLVDTFLKNYKFSHAVFIDADIGFHPNDILALLEMDKDIIGAVCSKKDIRWDRIQRACQKRASNGEKPLTGEEMALIGGNFVFNLEGHQSQNIDVRDPHEVKHIGTGLMMVKREVFLKMTDSFPERWYDSMGTDPGDLPGQIHDFFHAGVNEDTHQYDSEDWWFCADAKSLGFKVYMWPQMHTTHMGTFSFVGNMPAVAALSGEL